MSWRQAFDELDRELSAIAVFTDTDNELADLEDKLTGNAIRDPDADLDLVVRRLSSVGRARTRLRSVLAETAGSESESEA